MDEEGKDIENLGMIKLKSGQDVAIPHCMFLKTEREVASALISDTSTVTLH